VTGDGEERFPVARVCDLDVEEIEQRWLIEDLWSASAVGLIGGQPKCLKSWLALEMAVSVASATPCLGRYAVEDPGPTLVYLAEDSLAAVRQRISALALRRGVRLEQLPLHVITAASMRVDLERDQVRLKETVRSTRPRLLVLDPLVRIHRLDENSSADVSGFLAYLRELQRELDVAIVLVHHTRKNLTPGRAAGQSLRGSGDFHAWSDSGLYLSKTRGGDLLVTVEHRSAPAPEPLSIRLEAEPEPHLRILDRGEAQATRERDGKSIEERICEILAGASAPMTRAALRKRLAVQNARLGRSLEELSVKKHIERNGQGWRIASGT